MTKENGMEGVMGQTLNLKHDGCEEQRFYTIINTAELVIVTMLINNLGSP